MFKIECQNVHDAYKIMNNKNRGQKVEDNIKCMQEKNKQKRNDEQKTE